MVSKNEIEIMAPVGSFSSLRAAIQAGANSVYFGISRLNMRSKSSQNFTIDDLQEIVLICKKEKIKSYLTLNTVIYNNDLDLMKQIVDTAKKSDVSAIIASDMAVLNYAITKNVEIHMSTQANISNIEAVKFFAQFADVVVLAREVTLEQVGQISRAIKEEKITGPSGNLVKIEMFIHGALCMAISGKCYLSLHSMNYSANRGACLQVCRRAYRVTDIETGNELEIDNEYIMSPKDLCTIHFLNKILDAGVTVLKIEGRARSPEYVLTVTKCYKEALTAYFNNDFTKDKIDQWNKRLSSVFNRGFWDGYYLGQKLGEWSHKYGSVATRKKIYVGKITNYFSKIKVGEVFTEANSVKKGDEILIIGPTTGVVESVIDEIRIDDKKVTIAEKGVYFSMKIQNIIRRSDKIYKYVKRK